MGALGVIYGSNGGKMGVRGPSDGIRRESDVERSS